MIHKIIVRPLPEYNLEIEAVTKEEAFKIVYKMLRAEQEKEQARLQKLVTNHR